MFANREGFLDQLREVGLVADLTRVSRWESGRHAIPTRVLLAYEGILKMPPGALLALSRLLLRSSGVAPRLDPVPSADTSADIALDGLLSMATASGTPHDSPVLTGGQWVQLALELTRFDTVFLDSMSWQLLCTRLLRELARTSGPDRVRRYEACVTLLHHPAAQRRMLRALGEWLTHPDVQVVDPMLLLLREINEDAASDLVLRLLNGSSRVLGEGALAAAAHKAALGHFKASGVAELEGLLITRLSPADARPSVDTLDLAAHLPSHSLTKVLRRVRDPYLRERLELVSATRTLLPGDVARAVSRSVASATVEVAPGEMAFGADRMIDRLVQEMLFHVSAARRRLAARTIELTPFANAAANACLALTARQTEAVSTQAWQVVASLGHAAVRDDLVSAVFGESRPGLLVSALSSLGAARLQLTEGERAEVLALARRTNNGVRTAAIASLGLSGRQALASVRGLSADANRAAAWWEDLGGALVDGDS